MEDFLVVCEHFVQENIKIWRLTHLLPVKALLSLLSHFAMNFKSSLSDPIKLKLNGVDIFEANLLTTRKESSSERTLSVPSDLMNCKDPVSTLRTNVLTSEPFKILCNPNDRLYAIELILLAFSSALPENK